MLEFSDLLQYSDVLVDTNIGTVPQREVEEGDHEDLSLELAVGEELEGEVSEQHIRSFNQENKDPYLRLQSYILDRDREMFFSDDHQHALSAWLAAYNEGAIQGEVTLLHVDAHPDDQIPTPFRPPETADESIEQISDNLKINEFIYPAEQWGLIDEVQTWGVENYDIDDLRPHPSEPYIFDLDLDVFEALEDSETSPESYYEAISGLMRGAEFTTVATSPGYIHQDDALRHLDNIMERY